MGSTASMSYTYSFGPNGQIIRSDGATIPVQPLNNDYIAYEAWLAAGNTATPYVAPMIAPTALTYTFGQFLDLFTTAEQTAIITSTDAATKLFVIQAAGAGGIQLTNALTIAGVNYIATLTTATPPGPALITPARAAQVLAGTAP